MPVETVSRRCYASIILDRLPLFSAHFDQRVYQIRCGIPCRGGKQPWVLARCISRVHLRLPCRKV
jgi:hypothetical protein